jgi:hypothetical protein
MFCSNSWLATMITRPQLRVCFSFLVAGTAAVLLPQSTVQEITRDTSSETATIECFAREVGGGISMRSNACVSASHVPLDRVVYPTVGLGDILFPQ